MRRRRARIIPLTLLLLPAQPSRAAPIGVDIPSLPLVDALDRISAAFGISIGTAKRLDPAIRTRSVHGRLEAETALRRMLSGTGLRGEQLSAHTFRLVAVTPPPPAAPPTDVTDADIVVTAAKRRLPMTALPGEIERVAFDTPLGRQDQRLSPSALVTRVPSLTSTYLGAGRNKLFLRGIADSSFSGRTQGALGEYLGEARLNYNAPDPGLLLYDMKQVDILKGPQGTLYGGGTLAGVLRLEPERPDLSRLSGFADLAGAATQSGAPGYAAAAMLNLPIVQDQAGARLLVYRTRNGGYIDDARRRMSDVNTADITGFRGQVRARLADWTVDLLAVHQRIAARDADYAERGLPADTRAAAIAQPSANRLTLLDLEANHRGGTVDTTSATSIAWNRLGSTYDAEALVAMPAAYRDGRDIRTLNHETRISHTNAAGGGWLVGGAILAQHDRLRQDADALARPDLTSAFTSRQLELAAFGQYAIAFHRFVFTLGTRVAYARLTARADPSPFLTGEPRVARHGLRALPMATLTWKATPRLTISAGYRQGYRGGSATLTHLDHFLPVAPGYGLGLSNADTIQVANLAVVRQGGERRPYRIEAVVSGIAWDRVQADLIDPVGIVSTYNAGHVGAVNLDTSASIRPAPGLDLAAGATANIKYIRPYGTGFTGLVVGEIASIPVAAGYVDAAWSTPVSAAWTLRLEGRVSYIGHSRLGPGDLHAYPQGDVLMSSAIASIERKSYALSLSIDNLANAHGNLFAYGNPFAVRDGRQITPQRPRTVTLATHIGF